MRPFLFTFLLVAGGGPLFSQHILERFYGRSASSDDQPGYAAAAPDGGFFVTGTTAAANKLYDIFLLKTDAAGQQQWWRTYGGAADDAGLFVSATPDGGCVLGGRTASEGNGRADGFVKKIAADGTVEWTTLFGAGGQDEVTCVRPTADGGYVVCGNFVNQEPNGQDVFFAVLSPTGSIEGQETLDGPGLDKAFEIIEFATGGYLLHCYLPDDANFPYQIIKYNANGALAWQKSLSNGQFALYSQASLCAAPDGRIYLGSGYGRLPPFDSFLSTGVVACLRPDGTFTWASGLSGTLPEPFAFRVVPTGEVLVLTLDRPAPVASGGSLPQTRCFRLDAGGVVVATDTLQLPYSVFHYQQLLWANGAQPALLLSGFFDENDQHDPALLTTQGVFGQWQENGFQTYGSSLPNGHEYYLDAVRTGAGDFFAAASRYNPATSDYETWVLHTDAEGNMLQELAVPTGSPYLRNSIRLDPTADHGVLLFAGQISKIIGSLVARITPDGVLAWQRILVLPDSLVAASQFHALPDGGFAALAYGPSSNDHPACHLVRFDAEARLRSVTLLSTGFDAERQESLQVRLMIPTEDGFVLQGQLYNVSTFTYSLWLAFADAEGQLTRETRTEGYFYQDQWLRHTSDGGFLLAGSGFVQTATNDHQPVAGLLKFNALGRLDWNYDLFEQSLDGERRLAFQSVDELPCGDFVLAAYSQPQGGNLPAVYTAEKRVLVLQHISADGKGEAFFTLVDHESSSDFSFVPGYVYREWNDRRNAVTEDLHFRRINFEAADSPASLGEWSLSPNPSAAHVCLSLRNEYTGPVDVRWFDAAGRLLDGFSSHKQEAVWTYPYHANWAKGVYFVHIQAGETRKTVRWVKE